MIFTFAIPNFGIHYDDIIIKAKYKANYGFVYLVSAVLLFLSLYTWLCGILPLICAVVQTIIGAFYLIHCNVVFYACVPNFVLISSQSPLDFTHSEAHKALTVHDNIKSHEKAIEFITREKSGKHPEHVGDIFRAIKPAENTNHHVPPVQPVVATVAPQSTTRIVTRYTSTGMPYNVLESE
jgi:hypothetical protein